MTTKITYEGPEDKVEEIDSDGTLYSTEYRPHVHKPIEFSLVLSAQDPKGIMVKNIMLKFCSECKLTYYDQLPDSPPQAGMVRRIS